jgi:hypothetical protein
MCRKVHFRADPVQSHSRPLRHIELRILEHFEDHVREHSVCRRILGSSTPRNTCSYYLDISSYITSKFESQHGRYVEKLGDDDALTYVEFPRALAASRRILGLAESYRVKRSGSPPATRWSKDRSRYFDQPEDRTGSGLPVTVSRISVITQYSQWSRQYTAIRRTGHNEQGFTSRTSIATNTSHERRVYVARRQYC